MFDYVVYGINKSDSDVDLNSIISIDSVTGFFPQFWSEHCLECGAPVCYESCQLFDENEVGRCRRLFYFEQKNGSSLPIYRFKFKKWAKLRCSFNTCKSYANISAFSKNYAFHSKLIKIARVLDKPFLMLLPKSYRYPLSRLIHHNYIKSAVSLGGGRAS